MLNPMLKLKCKYLLYFHQIRPLGRFDLVVAMSLCLCVCPLFMYQILRPPLPEFGCPKFLEIRNPWGKVLERNGLRSEYFCREVVQDRRVKKSLFLLILPYKTWWKPRFPIDQRPLVKGYIANFGISLDVFEFFRFDYFFGFNFFFGFLCILGPPYCGIGANIRISQEIQCLPYAGFFFFDMYFLLKLKSVNILYEIHFTHVFMKYSL